MTRVRLLAAWTMLVGIMLLGLSAPALAQTGYPPGPATSVVEEVPPTTPPVVVQGLSRTGANVQLWVLVGLALIMVGAVFVIVVRRRHVPSRS